MRRFTVGAQFANAKDRNAAYPAYQQELREKLGIDFLGGLEPHKVIQKDGFFFVSDHGCQLYTHVDKLPRHPDFDAICECGEIKFKIKYDDCKCLGICVSCGMEHNLYSG